MFGAAYQSLFERSITLRLSTDRTPRAWPTSRWIWVALGGAFAHARRIRSTGGLSPFLAEVVGQLTPGSLASVALQAVALSRTAVAIPVRTFTRIVSV
jgi:hypothetical protein